MKERNVRNHQDLDVWKVSMEIAIRVYKETVRLPHTERFGLQQQMRRAAVSVASNIAEGAGRESTRDFLRFVSMAMGSLAELDTQLQLCDSLGLLSYETAMRHEIERNRLMLARLRASLRHRAAAK